MTVLRVTIILMFLCTYSFGQSSASPESNMIDCLQLLNDGSYLEAERNYKEILENGYESADLYYNLGLSNYHTKDYAEAILYFERALKLKPNLSEATKNLAFVKSEMIENVYEVKPFFLKKFWIKLVNLLPIWLWTFLSIASVFVLLWGMYNWLLIRSIEKKKVGFTTMMISLAIILLSVGALFQAVQMRYNSQYAIVMTQTPIYAGPNELSAVEGDVIPAGTKVKRLDELSGWIKVQLPDLDVSYLKPEMIEQI